MDIGALCQTSKDLSFCSTFAVKPWRGLVSTWFNLTLIILNFLIHGQRTFSSLVRFGTKSWSQVQSPVSGFLSEACILSHRSLPGWVSVPQREQWQRAMFSKWSICFLRVSLVRRAGFLVDSLRSERLPCHSKITALLPRIPTHHLVPWDSKTCLFWVPDLSPSGLAGLLQSGFTASLQSPNVSVHQRLQRPTGCRQVVWMSEAGQTVWGELLGLRVSRGKLLAWNHLGMSAHFYHLYRFSRDDKNLNFYVKLVLIQWYF